MKTMTQSYSQIIILLCLLKVEEIQAQCGRYRGGNRELVSEGSSFPNGATETVQCSLGYVPVDPALSRSITCTGSNWSDPALQCKKRSCGSPGDVAFGRYLTPDGIEFGAVATLKCNSGYMPSGITITRNCRENGWDGRPLECEAVKCVPPPAIENGSFEPKEEFYSYDDVVVYTCDNSALTLDGESNLVCSDDGKFSPSPPSCVLVKCDPPKIDFSIRIGGKSPPYGYKNYVEYKCNDGYTLIGESRLVCEVGGWDHPIPQCLKRVEPIPTKGPVPSPTPPPSHYIRDILIGVGVTAVCLTLIGCVVCYKKKSPGWGKVSSRNGAV